MEVESFTDEWHVADEVTLAARERGAGLPNGQPSPTTCGVLRAVACATNASAVVQAGADSGVSGLAVLAGMAPGGILTSIEATPEADRAARQTFREAGAGAAVRSITGNTLDVISRLADHAYDMVVVGADAAHRATYLAQARRLLRPGGAAVFLGVFGPADEVLDPARRDEATAAERHFLGELAEDPTVTATLLPIDGGVLVVQLPRD
ncbi:MAG: O-methyltransferase [Candidatus Nanopelagicales bacterium]